MKNKYLTSIKLVTLVALMIFAETLYAQTGKGVQFIDAPNWQAVLAKAKKENKGIFVDCYATWCAPCKGMDIATYPDTTLGHFMNREYISVKVQIDSTKKDNDFVKGWYQDAHDLMNRYQVKAFPTFLFFHPDGSILHRATGFMEPSKFITEAVESQYQSHQEYKLYKLLKEGKLATYQIPPLISLLRNAGEQKAADSVEHQYVYSYVLKLPEPLLMTKDNLAHLGNELYNQIDRTILELFCQRAPKIDQLVRKSYAENVLLGLILDKEIGPKIYTDPEKKEGPIGLNPDWGNVSESVKHKYPAMSGQIVNDAILYAQKDYYYRTKQDKLLASSAADLIERVIMRDDFVSDFKRDDAVNIECWKHIFGKGDPAVTNKAIRWMKEITERNPKNAGWLDTYANLLYYAGKRNEAIALKTKEATLRPDDKIVAQALQKMKEGKPTWKSME